ncbi:MAG TPA: aminomethyltransferase family protein [Longimicrobiales bacterium]
MNETLSLESLHEALGARFGTVAGRRVPRNYGDPAAEYDAVRHAAGIADRADRVALRVYGREPLKMIQGLVTNDVAGAPEGQGVYAALLTPKGKMVADVRIFRRPGGELLLDVDAAAVEGVLGHLRKYVPPLFAKVEPLDAALHVLGVYGPKSREVLAGALAAAPPPGLPEDAHQAIRFGGAELLVVRTGYVGEEGYDVFVPVASAASLWRALQEAGGRPVGHATLEVLRIEAGVPRWGAELDESVIPLEAGLRERAISTTKGCYTGQEVIIRILHRGHVNRLLRGIRLGDAPAPAPGTTLVRPDASKPVGRITSSCSSPLHEQTIALGYVRREIEPPAVLRLGAVDGPEAEVFELPIPIGA